MRVLIEQGATLYQLEELAMKQGFRTMFDVGVHKVANGQTSVEELRRVLGSSRYCAATSD